MPACSPCGQAVEWIRSCYSSAWYVWTDDPRPVKGRYYRVPYTKQGKPAVPAYPYPHFLASKTWWGANAIIEQPVLGELLGASAWNNGAQPVEVPSAVTVGEPGCIASGEPIASGLPLNSKLRFKGWPLACFVIDPLEQWGEVASVYRCATQVFWAQRIIEWETGEIGACTAAIQQALPGSTITFWPSAELFPPIITVVHPAYMVCVFDSTNNGEQALIEVIEGVLQPVDRGGFSTTLLWYTQAQRGLARLSAAGGGQQPVLFVGYSYGGAAAQCAAAIVRQASDTRLIRYLTFGAPRAGDSRLQDLLALPTNGCALANDNDAITAIPPNLESVLPVQTLLARVLLNFTLWEPARETYQQFPDGHIQPNTYPTLSTQELFELLQHVWTTHSFFGYPGHNIRTYLSRAALRCPAAPLQAAGALGLQPARLPGVGLAGPLKGLLGFCVGLDIPPNTKAAFGRIGFSDGLGNFILDETSGFVLLEDGTRIELE